LYNPEDKSKAKTVFRFYNSQLIQNIIYLSDYRIRKSIKYRKRYSSFFSEGCSKNVKERENGAKKILFAAVKGSAKE